MGDWKNEVSARVRAHRNRGSRVPANQPALPGMEEAVSPASIAARVAERYGRLPSWREMLEAQAAAARAAADAAADVANRAAAAPLPAPPSQPHSAAEAIQTEESLPVCEPYQPDLLVYFVSSDSLPAPRCTPAEARIGSHVPAGARSSGSSPMDPFADAVVEPAQPLPATVVTSPRELIAPRKARPRLAEGPLRPEMAAAGIRETADHPFAEESQGMGHSSASSAQAAPLAAPSPSAAPAEPPAPTSTEWRSIHLDTEAVIPRSNPSPALDDRLPLPVASPEDRAMAALVDFILTLSAFLVFSLVFALCTTNLPHGRVAVVGACAILLATWLLYQILFFTLTDATPGMRYAKIALCTFDDENPTHSALRGRIAALMLSALPLGLGFLWALFDEDGLGWHDRITRTYQRSYREF